MVQGIGIRIFWFVFQGFLRHCYGVIFFHLSYSPAAQWKLIPETCAVHLGSEVDASRQHGFSYYHISPVSGAAQGKAINASPTHPEEMRPYIKVPFF